MHKLATYKSNTTAFISTCYLLNCAWQYSSMNKNTTIKTYYKVKYKTTM